MQWDLGLQGMGVLLIMSLGFGIFAQLLFWSRTTAWVWLAGTILAFVTGLVISEVLFGWATQEELQPNIDGLSFDEVMIGFLVGIPLVLVARWYVSRSSHLPIPR